MRGCRAAAVRLMGGVVRRRLSGMAAINDAIEILTDQSTVVYGDNRRNLYRWGENQRGGFDRGLSLSAGELRS